MKFWGFRFQNLIAFFILCASQLPKVYTSTSSQYNGHGHGHGHGHMHESFIESSKNKTYNSTFRLRSPTTTVGFIQNKAIDISPRKIIGSLRMSTSSHNLRRDFTHLTPKDAQRSSYSLNNHQYIPSVALRQAFNDNDSETRIKKFRGGSKSKSKSKSITTLVEKTREDELTLPSSFGADDLGVPRTITERVRDRLNRIDVEDLAVIIAYASTQFAISIPIILIPMIAADPFGPGVANTINSAEFLGAIVSLSTLGAGIGKLINGFVCRAIGGRASGSLYLLGLSIFSVILSSTYSIHGYALAGMEFCASMLWTACNVMVSTRYANDSKKFTSSIMSLSLASTTGTIIAKIAGGALLSQYHWRQVCLLSATVGVFGSAMLYFFGINEMSYSKSTSRNNNNKAQEAGSINQLNRQDTDDTSGLTLKSIRASISNVLGNRMFYAIACAHFGSFIIRSSDKVMGTFIADATLLPRYLCGSLTTSITIGFVVGLITGRAIDDIDKISDKQAFISKRYGAAVVSALVLALCANRNVGAILGPYGLAAAITLFSGTLAASVAFQFYQLPPKYATSFGDDKAVYISFTDGFSFLLLSPFWSALSSLVAKYPDKGWSFVWLIVAAFAGVGGSIMTKSLPTVMRLEDEEDK